MLRSTVHSLLARHGAFVDVDISPLLAMVNQFEPVAVRPGDIALDEAAGPAGVCVVGVGLLRAVEWCDGKERDVAYFRPGDVFADAATVGGVPTGRRVVAINDCHLFRLPAVAATEMLGVDDQLRVAMRAVLAGCSSSVASPLPLDVALALGFAAPGERIGAGPGHRSPRSEPSPSPSEPYGADRRPSSAGAFETAEGHFAPRPGRVRRLRHIWQVDQADCGVACLAMVCRHFGRTPSFSRIRSAIGIGRDGASMHGLVRGAEALGFAARGVKVSRRHLEELPLPAIVHWEGDHWVVLYAIGAGHVRIANPATGLRRLTRAEFDAKWTSYAVLTEPRDRFAELEDAPRARTWLVPLMRPYRRTAVAAILLALAIAGAQMMFPVFIRIAVDRVVPHHDIGLLHLLVLSMLALLATVAVASTAQRYLLSKAAVRIDREMLDVLTGRVLAMPLRYFQTRRTGDIQRRLLGMRSVREFAVQNGTVALGAIMQLAAALVLMLAYSRLLLAVFLISAPIYAAIMRQTIRHLQPIFASLEEGFAKYSSLQVDAVKGIDTVKALGVEPVIRQQLVDEFDALSQRVFRADLTSMGLEAGVQLMTFASLTAFLWIGSLQVVHGHMTVGTLVSFNALVVLANGPIATLLFLWDRLQLNSVLLNRISDVFEEVPDQGEDHSDLLPVASLTGRVRCEGLSFAFGGPEDVRVLQDISFDVAPGATVALVGRSGSGKTTLVKCIAGLLDPTEGTIYYDTIDLRCMDHASLRRLLGFVPQQTYLFSDSVAANIVFGAALDRERLEWAAGVADAHDFIARLPFGYDTKVGETGILLSAGQQQRLAIARALYRRPPLLILDEASSALDTESERKLKENLARDVTSCTTFVIAHRLSTVRDADLILVLDAGRVVERGTHQELLARRGLYHHLVGQQLDL